MLSRINKFLAGKAEPTIHSDAQLGSCFGSQLHGNATWAASVNPTRPNQSGFCKRYINNSHDKVS